MFSCLDAKINVTNVFDGKKVSLLKTLPDDYLEFEILGGIVVVCMIMGVAMAVRRKRLRMETEKIGSSPYWAGI